MERTPAHQPTATPGEIAVEHAPNRQLLLPAPPITRSGRAAAILRDRWDALRNDVRLMVEDHMIAAPLVTLTAGFIAGRILHAMFSKPRQQSRGW